MGRRRTRRRPQRSDATDTAYPLERLRAELGTSAAAAWFAGPLASAGLVALVDAPEFRDAGVRVRAAELAECLVEWMQQAPGEALRFFARCGEMCQRARDRRDSAALAACMRGLRAVADGAGDDVRGAVVEGVPGLVEVVRGALFAPRVMYVEERGSLSDASLSASAREFMSGSSGAEGTGRMDDGAMDGVQVSAKLAGVRDCAIDALVALAKVAATAFIPYWSLFLPERDGISRSFNREGRRETLASMILFERSSDLRSKAVTAMSALLVGSRRYMLVSKQVAGYPGASQKGPAFTSTSVRVARVCGALYSIVSTALRTETSSVVLAQLAKLAGELCGNAPVPHVGADRVALLIRELLRRIADVENTDLTSRSAALVALSAAISASASSLSSPTHGELTAKLVAVLRSESGEERPPLAEALGALRALTAADVDSLLRCWSQISPPLAQTMLNTEDPVLCLHTARLVETALSQCVLRSSEDKAWHHPLAGEVGQGDSLWSWAHELYKGFVSRFLVSTFHPVRTCGMTCAGSLLQLGAESGCPLSTDRMPDGRPAEDAVRSDVVQIVDSLVAVASADGHVIVQSAAAKSLGYSPYPVLSVEKTLSTLHILQGNARDYDIALPVRCKSMWATSTLLDTIASHQNECTDAEAADAISELCTELVADTLTGMQDKTARGGGPADVCIEAFRTGALRVVSSSLACLEVYQETTAISSRKMAISSLCAIARDSSEFAKTRWNACKILGDLAAPPAEAAITAALHEALACGTSYKVQTAAAKALRPHPSRATLETATALFATTATHAPRNAPERASHEALLRELAALVHDALAVLPHRPPASVEAVVAVAFHLALPASALRAGAGPDARALIAGLTEESRRAVRSACGESL